MSLLERLEHLADERSADAIVRLADRAWDLANEHLTSSERDIAKAALAAIRDNREHLAHLSTAGIIGLITRFHLGEKEQAELAFIAESSSFEARRAASHAATADAVQAAVDHEAAWNATKAMLEQVGLTALKLIPLLLAAA